MRTPFLILTSLALLSATTQEQMVHKAQKKELEVHLKEPIFKDGVLTTDLGGVVTAEGMRIQAQNITFINKIENGLAVKKIIAEGNLLLEYAGKAFVGKKLEFNFLTRTGTLTGGKTYIDVWFIGGSEIQLRADGSYHIKNAFLTTSESADSLWDIHAGNVDVTKADLLSAKNIQFRFAKFPIMWLPSFKANLRFFKDPPIRYKIIWDKGLGPRATMRYRIYSWHDLNLYFRLDYRLKRGFGGAFESEYFSPDGLTTFITRSYGAHDKTVPDEHGKRRYRLQGLLDTQSQSGKTRLHASYDKMRDNKMPGDFRSDDFEVNTQKQTILWVHHQEDHSFATFRFQPRINNFQSLNQELPSILLGVKPMALGNTGIISQNNAKAAFLDYVFDKDLSKELPSRHSVRVATRNQLYRPFGLGPLTFTPNVGILAIFYNNNPYNQSIGQGVLTYGANLDTHLYRRIGGTIHQITPYARYEGISQPLANVGDVIIFNLNDGYARLNLIRCGVQNAFYKHGIEPTVAFDLFTYATFKMRSFHRTFPKAYGSVGYQRPSYALYAGGAWNIQQNLLDYFNIRLKWTLSADLAVALEYRHRSRFDWRKANRDNFIVDSARSLHELLDSPLSDGRNTLLTNLYARLSPRWTAHFESHHGWGRRDEPSYTSAKIELFTLLTTSWQLRVSFEHMPNDDRFGAGIALVK